MLCAVQGVGLLISRTRPYRVISLIRTSPLQYGHHMALGMVLLQGPRGAQLIMREVPV